MDQDFSFSAAAGEIEARIRANRPVSFPASWRDEIVFPHYDALSIANLAQSTLAFAGVSVEWPLADMVWGGELDTKQIDRVVLILTDGMGYLLLNELIAEDPALRSHIGQITDGRGPVPLTSTLPSTTAVALPTLWTGAFPGVHGMVGTTVYLRQFSLLVNMLKYSPLIGQHGAGAIEDWGLSAAEFVPVRSVSERLLDVDMPTHVLLAKELMGTGLSKILHRGVAHRHLMAGLSDAFYRLKDILADTKGQRAYISMYLSNVDTLSHLYGHRSGYVKREIRRQMQALNELLSDRELHDGRTLVLILADHGHHDTHWALNLDSDAAVAGMSDALRMTYSGDSCLSHLFLRSDGRERLIEEIDTRFAEYLTYVDPQILVDAGLYGPGDLHPDLHNRLGDLTVLSRRGARLADSARPWRAKSWHGGLSEWEMIVPLLWKHI